MRRLANTLWGGHPLILIAKVLGGLIALNIVFSLFLTFFAFTAPAPSLSADTETIAAYTRLLHLRQDYMLSIFDNLASKILIPVFALVLGAILSR